MEQDNQDGVTSETVADLPETGSPKIDWKKYYTKTAWVLVIFFVLTVAIYGRTLWGDFVFDDRGVVDHFSSLSNPFEIKKIFLMPYWTEEAGLYRPVTIYTYALNYFILGTSSFGFHLVNLVLYGLTCFYLFDLLRRVFNNKIFAFLSALIFLVLPIHTEVVANIIGRAEIMALLFSLLFLVELTKKEISPWKIGLWFFLAIGSKETAIAVIPIALLLVYLIERERGGAILKRYLYPTLSALTAGVLYFSLRLLVLGPSLFIGVQTSIVENPLFIADTPTRVFTAFKVLSMYVGKSVVPLNLCSDYSFNQIPAVGSILNAPSLFGLAIFVGFFVGIFFFIKKQPALSLGSAFFVFAFLPVSNLLFPIGTIAGERLMFYPSVGIAMFGAFIFLFIFQFLKERSILLGKKVIVIFAIILTAYSFVGAKRAGDWLTEKRLFTSAAKCAPNSVLSLSNMGTVYYFDGDYEKAEAEFLASMKIYDGYSKGLNNLGLVYWKKGDNKKAEEYYLKAINTKFPYPGAYENMALLYLSKGDVLHAKKWLEIFFSDNEELVDGYLRRRISNY